MSIWLRKLTFLCNSVFMVIALPLPQEQALLSPAVLFIIHLTNPSVVKLTPLVGCPQCFPGGVGGGGRWGAEQEDDRAEVSSSMPQLCNLAQNP
jgi:hypothetical protein